MTQGLCISFIDLSTRRNIEQTPTVQSARYTKSIFAFQRANCILIPGGDVEF